ncbi:MAG: hypothetical protein ACI8W8_003703 [Rhodothermales bacterium]|jgi:hypothetical protein
MRSSILIVNAASTLAMTGLIWLVQLLHYPSFSFVCESNFAKFAVFHQQRISIVVVPLMLFELISTLLLLHRPHVAFPARLAIAGAICLGIAWFSTFLLQVPVHQQLVKGQDGGLVAELVAGNWVRTAAWSARAVLICVALQRCAAAAQSNPNPHHVTA